MSRGKGSPARKDRPGREHITKEMADAEIARQEAREAAGSEVGFDDQFASLVERDDPDDYTYEQVFGLSRAPIADTISISAPPADSPTDDTEGKTQVLLRKASGMMTRGVDWLYEGRIPLGMMTMLAGREGIGKSTVALDIAARLTRGELDGIYYGKPKSVVVCATEDSWEHTIKPRLEALGADLDRIYAISIGEEDGTERSLSFPRDTRRIEAALEKDPEIALAVIDPVVAVVDGKVDTHKQAEVQQALEPIIKVCARRERSILGLIHVNKSGGNDPLNSIMGSKAFATLPRSVLFCSEVKEDDGSSTYLMSHEKCNVGPKVATLQYSLETVHIPLDESEQREGRKPYVVTSRVIWGGEDSRTAGDIMAEAQAAAKPGGRLATEIATFLREANDQIPLKEIHANFPEVTLGNVKTTLSRLKSRGFVKDVGDAVWRYTGKGA